MKSLGNCPGSYFDGDLLICLLVILGALSSTQMFLQHCSRAPAARKHASCSSSPSKLKFLH